MHGIDGLPTRDRVGARDGVNGREIGADISGAPSGPFEKGEPSIGGDGRWIAAGQRCRSGFRRAFSRDSEMRSWTS